MTFMDPKHFAFVGPLLQNMYMYICLYIYSDVKYSF